LFYNSIGLYESALLADSLSLGLFEEKQAPII
jgi:hypothetical protein